MLWGGESPSIYRGALKRFAADLEDANVFSDAPDEAAGELHYLRFPALDSAGRFELVLHNVDDGAEFSASFPYIARRPGVLFLGDVFLHRYARAVSHSPRDGWGYRWILGVACPEQADALARLAEHGIDPGALTTNVPLARALAVRSAAVVVPDFRSQHLLGGGSDMPPVSVIPPPEEGFDAFASTLRRVAPHWLARTARAEETIAPLEHPNRDLLEVERGRVREHFGGGGDALLRKALERLDELFGADPERA